MHLVRRKGQVVYEDLLRELELVEQQLMTENSAMAMTMMVLEAKLRDRFHQMDQQIQQTGGATEDDILIKDDFTAADIRDLIPRDLPAFPEAPTAPALGSRKTMETVGLAALLAMATALGVFGLATALQVALGWFA